MERAADAARDRIAPERSGAADRLAEGRGSDKSDSFFRENGNSSGQQAKREANADTDAGSLKSALKPAPKPRRSDAPVAGPASQNQLAKGTALEQRSAETTASARANESEGAKKQAAEAKTVPQMSAAAPSADQHAADQHAANPYAANRPAAEPRDSGSARMAARSGGGGTSLDAATASSAASAAGEPVGDASKSATPPAVISGPMQAAREKLAGEAAQAKERRGAQPLADEKSKTLARHASPAASEAASNKPAGAAKPAGNARDAIQSQGGSGKFGDAFPWLEMRSPSGSIVWRAGRAGRREVGPGSRIASCGARGCTLRSASSRWSRSPRRS